MFPKESVWYLFSVPLEKWWQSRLLCVTPAREHTGRYYEPVAQFLCDEDIFVSAVNPKLIKDYGNNSLRRVKTDKADAVKIARYALDNWEELRRHTPMDTIRYQLKTLNRQQGLYSKTKTMRKNNLIALLDQTYPGVNALFDSPASLAAGRSWLVWSAQVVERAPERGGEPGHDA